jgi:hypothetical protein
MALDFENSIGDISDLDLWFKVSNDETLYLSDIPEIIRLRWPYFRDNWNFIKEQYIALIDSYANPNKLKLEIRSFSEFVDYQRTSKSKNNPFDNENILYRFFAIFDNTEINSVSLSFEETKILEEKLNRIKSFNRNDFEQIREQLINERDAISDRVGTTDVTYNKTFNRSPQAVRVDIKNKDVNNMYSLQQAIKSVEYILANSFSLENSFVDPFALAKANANNPDIDIASYASGSMVKLNYGEDLQALAKRTLGDPDKWLDIAVANGLKPPYIDEIGEKLLLISNASRNQLNIAGKDSQGNLNIDKLYVGQVVILLSDTEKFPEQRSILNIKEVPISGEVLIELDGEQNLERYRLDDNAYVRIYKPGTTNSSFYILIPSEEAIPQDITGDTPWFLKSKDVVEKRQKVDLNLDEKGDLTFSSTGDLQLIYGLDNSIQAIKLKLSTELGELRRHEDYGLAPITGLTNINLIDVKNILTQSIIKNIEDDVRFAGIETLDVFYLRPLDGNTPTAFSITLVVRLAGSDQLVPITFSVNT